MRIKITHSSLFFFIREHTHCLCKCLGKDKSWSTCQVKMASHLSGGKVNVAQVQELARKELLLLLGKCDGSKVQ